MARCSGGTALSYQAQLLLRIGADRLSRYNCGDWEDEESRGTTDHMYYGSVPENEWTHVRCSRAVFTSCFHEYCRLSGQDVERGTFNQRHAVLWDQVTRFRVRIMVGLTGEL